MNIPEPQASKLHASYDTALLGHTVGANQQFAYSLKALVGIVMRGRGVQAPEARQIVLAEMVKPHAHEVTFVNDEIMVEEEKPKIVVPKQVGNRRWQ